MDITIRGQSYSITEISDLHILPLSKLYGIKTPPEPESPLYEKWKIEITNIFTEPANQAAVAYVLTSLFPNIDPAIARYKIKRYDEGYSEIDFYVAINIDELLAVLQELNPMIQARADALKPQTIASTPPKAQGFGQNKEQRKASLMAELAALEA
jgi:hypothetical protein